jgi:hypothetical protein
MSKEIEDQVDLILKNCEVTYLATHAGQRKRDGWDCDAWLVSFTLRDGRAEHEEFDYFTGLGHRKPDDSAMAKMSAQSLRNVSKRMIAWEDHYKRFPGKVVRPHAAGVLHSLLLDADAAEQSFASWCSELGYDTDSRKALATYEACQANSDKLCRVFDRVAREALREALQDY